MDEARNELSNEISGGVQYGPVVMAQNIERLTFTIAPPATAGATGTARTTEAAGRPEPPEPAAPPAPAAPEHPLQHNTATDGASLYAVANGDMHINHHGPLSG